MVIGELVMAQHLNTDISLLQARMTATQALAETARQAVQHQNGTDRTALAPFLDRCARELEATAQMIKAAAEDAARPAGAGCSS